MAKEFTGHVAFVTGGGSGIGLQICKDLADEGASVVVSDINAKAASDAAASLPTGDGSSHLGIHVDVSKKTDVEAALAQVMKTYGRPADLIVNNAGVSGGVNKLEKLSEETIDECMNVNFKGTLFVTQVFGKALLNLNKPGAIVNISSIMAYSPVLYFCAYCSSKSAMTQFTKVAAMEWGPKGIRINAVHPGLIETPMTSLLVQTPNFKNYVETSSLRRLGQPKDVSNVVLFALSKKSGFVTGAGFEVSCHGVI